MSSGVGCLGSPMPRLIGAYAGFGRMSLVSPRRRSNGYGWSLASSGFMGSKRPAGGEAEPSAACSTDDRGRLRIRRQLDPQRRLPALLPMLGDDVGVDATAHVPLGGDA